MISEKINRPDDGHDKKVFADNDGLNLKPKFTTPFTNSSWNLGRD